MGGGDRGGVDIFSLIINQGVFLFPKGPLIHPNLLLSLFTPTPYPLFSFSPSLPTPCERANCVEV